MGVLATVLCEERPLLYSLSMYLPDSATCAATIGGISQPASIVTVAAGMRTQCSLPRSTLRNALWPGSSAGTIYSHVLIWRFDASVIAAESATHPGMERTAPVAERLSGHIGVVWCLAWYGQLPLTVPLRLG